MNWLDITIAVILLVSVLSGLKTGIIKSVLGLVGLVAGIVLAGQYYLPFSEQLTFIPQQDIARIVAFAIIVIVVMIIASIIGAVLHKLAKAVMLGWINHLGGAAFGLIMGGIFIGALLALWVQFFGDTSVINDSVLARLILQYFPLALSLLPDEFNSVRELFQ